MATPAQIREIIRALQERLYMLDYIEVTDGELSEAEQNEYDQINRMLALPNIIEHINVANPDFNPQNSNLTVDIEDVCPICLDDLKTDICRNICGHVYHCNCISYWVNKSDACPICRAPLDLVRVNINNFGKNTLNRINSDIFYLKNLK